MSNTSLHNKLTQARGRRRDALKYLFGGAAAARATIATAPQARAVETANDIALLQFALNVEYLEAEYYLNGMTGSGLETAGVPVTGSGVAGSVIIKANPKVTFATDSIRQYFAEIADDEKAHVTWLRNLLTAAGVEPVARPALDLRDSFTAAARAAKLVGNAETFDPFANQVNFLVGAFIFEDVGVTAYTGFTPMITNLDFLEGIAGLLATESYHAGLIRTLLYQGGPITQDASEGISDLRDKLDGGGNDDFDVTGRKDLTNIVPGDKLSVCFSRTTSQVLRILYLNKSKNAHSGGFFPAGLNGVIR